MTQKNIHIADWLVSDNYRAKAQLKYEIKHLESRFNRCWEHQEELAHCSEELGILGEIIANHYTTYLKLIDVHYSGEPNECHETHNELSNTEQFYLIRSIKQKLHQIITFNEEIKLVSELAFLYARFKHHNKSIHNVERKMHQYHSDKLLSLFHHAQIESWLINIVDFCNLLEEQHIELATVLRDWTPQNLQYALSFFTEEHAVDLVNALFFYKLYPDKLFTELIHPEKLVSIRMRLGLLHHHIEVLHQLLHYTAMQHGLKPDIDHLFHGDELPQGIMIEVNEQFKEMIQLAIKSLKTTMTAETEEQVTLERLHDLGRAYKFWFNPNRLIDAVMLLQQRLVGSEQDDNLLIFNQKMVLLFRQLTTTECLDLYGYFANNDSRYLLYTLFTIAKGGTFDWLPPLDVSERNAIERIFYILQCTMEALRIELKCRHVSTQAYIYDLGKQQIHSGKRNRDAVFRALVIYGRETANTSEKIDKLFRDIEDSN